MMPIKTMMHRSTGDPYFANVSTLLHFDSAMEGDQRLTCAKGKAWYMAGAGRPKTWNAGGNAQADTAQSKFGGSSLILDGTGDVISTADSADWEPGAGDFTVEAWVRFAALPNLSMILWSKYTATGSQRSMAFQINPSGSMSAVWSTTGGAGPPSFSGAATFVVDQWHHVAWTRNSTDMRLWLDGVQVAITTALGAGTIFGGTSPVAIGAWNSSGSFGNFFAGWIDEFRFTKGTCRYTGTFTPPTDPFPVGTLGDAAFANVKSLLHFDAPDAAVATALMFDTYQHPYITLVEKKYGLSSLRCDGTLHRVPFSLNHVDYQLGNGDFTIEAAVRFTSFPGAGVQMDICAKYDAGTSLRGYIFRVTGDGSALQFLCSTDGGGSLNVSISGAFTFALNTWYQVAVVRSGVNLYLYVDGAQVATNTTIGTGTIYTAGAAPLVLNGHDSVGTYQDPVFGYIDEFRLTKGVARYTGSVYAAPTAPFPDFAA
jgi:hypothetical protein